MVIRFIHTADLHLDRPYHNLSALPESLYERVMSAPFKALHNLITCAIEHEVDFIIISGDVFDGSNPSLRAEHRFYKEILRLTPYGIPVYLVHGNHDPLDRLRSLEPHPLIVRFPEQVNVEKYQKPNRPIVYLYGFSYPTRHVHDSMTAFYKKESGADFHIGILHGYLRGSSEHEPYAPFSVQELAEKNFNYWALGHIHQRQQLSETEPIFYSGSPQGLSIKETGDKGINLVTLSEKGANVTFLSTAEFLFETVKLDISHVTTLQQLIQNINIMKETRREDGKPCLLQLKLEGQGDLHKDLQDPNVRAEILETVHDGEEDQQIFCWVLEIHVQTSPFYPREQWNKEAHFLGDLIRMVDQTESIEPLTSELFKHSLGKRYLDSLSGEEENELLLEAEQLVIRRLMDEEGDLI